MGLTEPFNQIPSEDLAHRVELDHPAGQKVACLLPVNTSRRPITHFLYLESYAGINTVSGEAKNVDKGVTVLWGLQWQRLVREKQCEVRELRYEVWSAAVSPPWGMTPFPAGPVRWPVWLVPLLKDGLQLWVDTTGLRARLAYTAFLLIQNTRTLMTD